MKRFAAATGTVAFTLALAGCSVHLSSHQDRLDESPMRDEVIAAVGPTVSDVRLFTIVDDGVLITVILRVNTETFRPHDLCTVVRAAVHSAPFATNWLAFGLYPPDSDRYLDTSEYFEQLGVDSAEALLGEAVLEWDDASALADQCPEAPVSGDF